VKSIGICRKCGGSLMMNDHGNVQCDNCGKSFGVKQSNQNQYADDIDNYGME